MYQLLQPDDVEYSAPKASDIPKPKSTPSPKTQDELDEIEDERLRRILRQSLDDTFKSLPSCPTFRKSKNGTSLPRPGNDT